MESRDAIDFSFSARGNTESTRASNLTIYLDEPIFLRPEFIYALFQHLSDWVTSSVSPQLRQNISLVWC